MNSIIKNSKKIFTATNINETFEFVNPEMYGAVGNGVSDDTIALQDAIDSGFPVYLSNKTYLTTGLTITDNVTIIGGGYNSVIKTTSNAPVINITGSNNTIRGIRIEGNSTGTSQNGIQAIGNVGFTLYYLNNIISECYFLNLGGSGIYGEYIIGSSTGNNHEGIYTASNNIFKGCLYGINMGVRAEYSNFVNNKIEACTNGINIVGGNNNVIGGQIVDCTNGFILGVGANDSHSSASGLMINHNTNNIVATSAANGYLFNGCMIYSGNVNLTSTTGIHFSNCFFGTVTINSTNTVGTQFKECKFKLTPTISTTGTAPLYFNCKFEQTQPTSILNIGGSKVDISSTSTVTGWSSTTTKDISIWAAGNTLFVKFDIRGTSSSATTNLTIPFAQEGSSKFVDIYAQDLGVALANGGVAQCNGSASVINFYKDYSTAAFSNSGTKWVIGVIALELNY